MILLNEATSKELLSKSRKDTPKRYLRRLEYLNKMTVSKVDTSDLKNSPNLEIKFKVGNYDLLLNILNFEAYLMSKIKEDTPVAKYPLLIRSALKSALRSADIQINCSCPDFKYRFAYMATKKKYLVGGHELRPAKITNPKDRGGLCKHLIAILKRPSKWQGKVVTRLSTYLKKGEWRK